MATRQGYYYYYFVWSALFLLPHGLVVALDNGLALTPPMGWLSWERFGCQMDCQAFPDSCISEHLYLAQGQLLASEGYRDAGYHYVNIDDCWSEMERDQGGNLVADHARFPSGMRSLSQQLHDLGLLLGLYGDIGDKTCAGYPGSEGFYPRDANLFALEFEIDALKVDGCSANVSAFDETFPAFGAALNKTGRPILYSSVWPKLSPGRGEDPDILTTIVSKTCNLWRNQLDIYDGWAKVKTTADFWSRNSSEDVLVRAAGPGHWNDPDMLVVGNPGLSRSEQQAQFALWAMFAAPLYISADLRTMPDDSKEILLNAEIIAVDQDPLGHQGWCAEGCPGSDLRVYVRELQCTDQQHCGALGTSNAWAVLLANFRSVFQERTITFDPALHLPQKGIVWDYFQARDIIEHVNLPGALTNLTVSVDESSVAMFRIVLCKNDVWCPTTMSLAVT